MNGISLLFYDTFYWFHYVPHIAFATASVPSSCSHTRGVLSTVSTTVSLSSHYVYSVVYSVADIRSFSCFPSLSLTGAKITGSRDGRLCIKPFLFSLRDFFPFFSSSIRSEYYLTTAKSLPLHSQVNNFDISQPRCLSSAKKPHGPLSPPSLRQTTPFNTRILLSVKNRVAVATCPHCFFPFPTGRRAFGL
jgi:hypothetical protein